MKKILICVLTLSLMGFSMPERVEAQERYLGEVFWVGFNFCPRGSLDANGQLLPISQNSALFSLFGTMYGGDGRTTFALPDLRGRVSIHTGTGPGLNPYRQGQRGGAESKVLSINELPSHNHGVSITAKSEPAAQSDPSNNYLAQSGTYRSSGTDVTIKGAETHNTGRSQSFSLRSPYLTMRACVATIGLYPSRN